MALYDTIQKQQAFLSTRGNIVTFKERQYPFGKEGRSFPQIIVGELEFKKTGQCRIVGYQIWSTDWYNNINALVQQVNWEEMESMHEGQIVNNY